jgi:hypothetical protein
MQADPSDGPLSVPDRLKISSGSIDRILNAIGVRSSRPHFNKVALAKSIDVCASWYGQANIYNVSARQRERRAKLQSIGEAARNLCTLTHDLDPLVGNLLPEKMGDKLSELIESVNRARELKSGSSAASGVESDFIDRLVYEDHFKERSSFEWIASVYLAEVYELHFGDNVGRSEKRKYVMFVYAVLRELKIKKQNSYYSLKTIRRAVRDYRVRRKGAIKIEMADNFQNELARHRELQAACGLFHPSKHYSLADAHTTLLEFEKEKGG